MPALTIAALAAVIHACTPTVAGQPVVDPGIVASVADHESGRDVYAIHDNSSGEALHPASADEATALATRLISAGHRPDLGLLQINAANLSRTDLTVRTAFDPCQSVRAGAQVLLDAYEGGASTVEQQAAILRALSTYNTGSHTGGLRTYVPAVLASARKIIPALHIEGVVPEAASFEHQAAPPPTPPAPPDAFAHPAAPSRELVYAR